jgi:uncharacterized coiled-coil protein SlyX
MYNTFYGRSNYGYGSTRNQGNAPTAQKTKPIEYAQKDEFNALKEATSKCVNKLHEEIANVKNDIVEINRIGTVQENTLDRLQGQCNYLLKRITQIEEAPKKSHRRLKVTIRAGHQKVEVVRNDT